MINMMCNVILKLAEEKEKWEDERQEKEKLLYSTHLLEEQMKEKEEEVKALLEKQVLAVEETAEKLKTSHQLEKKDLMEKHQQEVGFTNCKYCPHAIRDVMYSSIYMMKMVIQPCCRCFDVLFLYECLDI